MFIHTTINVVDLFFDTQQNLLVLCVLFRVPLVESRQPPHHGTANKGDDNRDPPHVKSHPTIPNRFGIDSCRLGLSHLGFLPLLDRRPMEIFLSMAETQTNRANMTLKANSPTAWQHIKRKQIVAFGTVDRTHHY